MGNVTTHEATKGKVELPQIAKRKLYGLLAEFDHPESLMEAAEKVRDAGFEYWDSYTPFPVHGMDKAMGIKRTILPVMAFVAGITGTTIGFLMQWWMNAVDYPFLISGKPMMSLPAFIPIMFELTILLAAITTFAGMLFLNRLPEFYHPIFQSDRFRRVTNDRFFILIESRDANFDEEQTSKFLASLKPTAVEKINE